MIAKQAQLQMHAIAMHLGAIVKLQNRCNFQIEFATIFDPLLTFSFKFDSALSHLNEKVSLEILQNI